MVQEKEIPALTLDRRRFCFVVFPANCRVDNVLPLHAGTHVLSLCDIHFRSGDYYRHGAKTLECAEMVLSLKTLQPFLKRKRSGVDAASVVCSAVGRFGHVVPAAMRCKLG